MDEGSIDFDSLDLSSCEISLQDYSKTVDFNEYDIWIVDPWKTRLKKERWDELILTNSKINIQFVKRFIKDQGSEGSCVLCSFARILYTLQSIDLNSHDDLLQLKDNLSNPIPDFTAYLTSYIFRNCI